MMRIGDAYALVARPADKTQRQIDDEFIDDLRYRYGLKVSIGTVRRWTKARIR